MASNINRKADSQLSKGESISFAGLSGRQVHDWFIRWIRNNDPSAGSPTETLLRLLLPLNDQV